MKTPTNEKYRVKQTFGKSFIAINTDDIEGCITFMKENNIKNITIHRTFGYNLSNCDFLKEYPFIEGVFVVNDDIDVSAIHSLPNLKLLVLSGETRHELDFAHFPDLEICNINWKFKIRNLEKCTKLKELKIRKYNPKSKNLSEIPEFPKLELLEFVQSTIENFQGAEHFPKLKKLDVHYLRNLKSTAGIEKLAKTLEFLMLQNCKNISDIESIPKLQKLYWLTMTDCGEIASIKFIEQIPSLRKFTFGRTNVLDGDMSPCIGLEYVAFTNKKHFSHKMQDIREMNKEMLSAEKSNLVGESI